MEVSGEEEIKSYAWISFTRRINRFNKEITPTLRCYIQQIFFLSSMLPADNTFAFIIILLLRSYEATKI